MKNLRLVLALISFFAIQQSFAQFELTKEEKKEWKAKMKELGPAGLKDLAEENEANKVKVVNLEARTANLEQEKEDLETEIARLKKELASKPVDTVRAIANVDSTISNNTANNTVASAPAADDSQCQAEKAQLEAEITRLKRVAKNIASTPSSNNNQSSNSTNTQSSNQKGIVFKVQIGAFKDYDLRKYAGNHSNFGVEIDADGTMRYTLGQFKDYWQADTFKKYLRGMGVKGAWIVAYKDGKRANIKDVLEDN
ncbi:MAG: Ezrin/radixin/moesin family protein [Cytophagales bacterium]|nr:Ezrin/radixin/moesin family protein [Cytophagales bacterium]